MAYLVWENIGTIFTGCFRVAHWTDGIDWCNHPGDYGFADIVSLAEDALSAVPSKLQGCFTDSWVVPQMETISCGYPAQGHFWYYNRL